MSKKLVTFAIIIAISLLVPVSIVIYLNYRNNHKNPQVNTKLGLIRGIRSEDGDFCMYLGIPYAKINDSNVFGPSLPHPKFDEVFEAYNDSAICPQIQEDTKTYIGALPCLNLNIYVPHSKHHLPVVVYIHDGRFAAGYSSRYIYGPKFLVDKGIILVTFNYRLGPYGFLCLDNPEVPGNQGLKDQVMALRWIHDNIEAFGGDVNRITVAGHGTGGESVDLHLYSPQEKLFDQLIMECGNALSLNMETPLQGPNATNIFTLTKSIGFITNDVNQALLFLSKVHPRSVIETAHKRNIKFVPCIEKDYPKVEKFITDIPINLNTPKARNISILIGTVPNELSYKYEGTDAIYTDFSNIFYDEVKKVFAFDKDRLFRMESMVRRSYLGDKEVNIKARDKLIEFSSDFYSHATIERSVDKYLDSGANNIFYYVFDYNGDRNIMRNRYNLTSSGSARSDQIGYVFDVSYLKDRITPQDHVTVERLSILWTNFIKTGDPTHTTTKLLPVKWMPVTKDSSFYLNISTEVTSGKRPFRQKMAFWTLFYKINEKYQKGYRERARSKLNRNQLRYNATI